MKHQTFASKLHDVHLHRETDAEAHYRTFRGHVMQIIEEMAVKKASNREPRQNPMVMLDRDEIQHMFNALYHSKTKDTLPTIVENYQQVVHHVMKHPRFSEDLQNRLTGCTVHLPTPTTIQIKYGRYYMERDQHPHRTDLHQQINQHPRFTAYLISHGIAHYENLDKGERKEINELFGVDPGMISEMERNAEGYDL